MVRSDARLYALHMACSQQVSGLSVVRSDARLYALHMACSQQVSLQKKSIFETVACKYLGLVKTSKTSFTKCVGASLFAYDKPLFVWNNFFLT